MNTGDVWIYTAHTDNGVGTGLSVDEQRIAGAINHPRQRMQYMAGRRLLRTALSLHHWRETGEYRPETDWWLLRQNGRTVTDRTQTRWQVSLSHSGSCIGCLLSTSPHCGIDLEAHSRSAPTLAIARRYFHGDEYEALVGLDEPERQALFLSLWTRKEATIKACHVGIAGYLPRIVFDPATLAPISLPEEFGDLSLQFGTWTLGDWLMSGAVASTIPLRWHHSGNLLREPGRQDHFQLLTPERLAEYSIHP